MEEYKKSVRYFMTEMTEEEWEALQIHCIKKRHPLTLMDKPKEPEAILPVVEKPNKPTPIYYTCNFCGLKKSQHGFSYDICPRCKR